MIITRQKPLDEVLNYLSDAKKIFIVGCAQCATVCKTGGEVVNPGANPLEPELIKFEKKIEAGAEFFQTQGIYDVEAFAKFIDKVKNFNACIIAGIILLKSGDMARYMNKNVAGIFVPDNLIKEIEGAQDRQAKSVELAARLVKELKGLAHGVHIMSIGWNKLVPRVLDAAGL